MYLSHQMWGSSFRLTRFAWTYPKPCYNITQFIRVVLWLNIPGWFSTLEKKSFLSAKMYWQRKTKWDTISFPCWCKGRTGNGYLQLPDADKLLMSILNLVAYVYLITHTHTHICIYIYIYISDWFLGFKRNLKRCEIAGQIRRIKLDNAIAIWRKEVMYALDPRMIFRERHVITFI